MDSAKGYSAIGGRLDGKITAVTMFAGRLFAATKDGVFVLDEGGAWARILAVPIGAAADLEGIHVRRAP